MVRAGRQAGRQVVGGCWRIYLFDLEAGGKGISKGWLEAVVQVVLVVVVVVVKDDEAQREGVQLPAAKLWKYVCM
jgi:hypothetical protein